ncbi:MAG: radical SAM family heme chaperone HemW, partial [Myxococcales bacterium]
MDFGVYLHFPYCLSKCPYCDFASKVVASVPHRRYARAVAKELALRAAVVEGRTAVSLFNGGGTPSLWDPEALDEALGAIRETVRFAPDAEFTLEANPGASDARRFGAFRRAGINRLSIGVQSFHPRSLAALGRRHTGNEAERAFASAREAGFDNVSLDLIYGAPGQDVQMAVDDAARAVALGPDHLSCYALTLDIEALAEAVPLAKKVARGRVRVPDDEAQAEMGARVREVLAGGGYARYEISNYARRGLDSRHNTLYWVGAEYLGLGCGACGFSLNDPSDPSKGGRRYGNVRSPEKYLEAIEAGRLPEQWSEELT